MYSTGQFRLHLITFYKNYNVMHTTFHNLNYTLYTLHTSHCPLMASITLKEASDASDHCSTASCVYIDNCLSELDGIAKSIYSAGLSNH